MMNADMFKQWVEGRLMPTFEALYGKGTALGGENGKKMIVIMGVYTMHLFFRLKWFANLLITFYEKTCFFWDPLVVPFGLKAIFEDPQNRA